MPIIHNYSDVEEAKMRSICQRTINTVSRSYMVGYTDLDETVRRLVMLRKSRKLSIKEVSKVVRWSEQTIKNIEAKEDLCDLETLIAFSDLYGVSIDYLLAEDVQPEQLTLFE